MESKMDKIQQEINKWHEANKEHNTSEPSFYLSLQTWFTYDKFLKNEVITKPQNNETKSRN